MTSANTLDPSLGTQGQQQDSMGGGQMAAAGGQQQSGLPDQQGQQQGREINVGQQERLISAGAGALIALYGLKRLRLSNLVLVGLGGMLIKRAVTGQCGVYSALGFNSARGDAAEPHEYFERGIHVEESFTIMKSPEELYNFWHNFENLPHFMKHLESVKTLDEKRSTWVAKAPAGSSVKWDAEIINDEPGKLIAWRSLAGAQVDNAGSIQFVDGGDRGTEVKVTLEYVAPAGRFGKWVAKLFGEEPQQQVQEDLRRFKRLMETGEIPTTEGQPRGSCTGGLRGLFASSGE